MSYFPFKVPFSLWHVLITVLFCFFLYVACDDVLTEETGVIISPNYPSSYPPDSDCTFYVSIPAVSGIRVEFSDFELENTFDHLYYGVGRNNAVASAIGELSGSFTPDPIYFRVGVVWFRFISDGSLQSNGFYLTFTATVRKFTQSCNSHLFFTRISASGS